MQLFAGAAAKKTAGDADLVKDGSLKTFAQDVIQASQRVAVLVDCWSPRSPQSKPFSQLLEKVVRAAKGKVRLVRINIDQAPELAQQLRIQAVPTVCAFAGGQYLGGMAGPQPESQIKLLIEQLLGEAVGGVPGDGLEQAVAAAERGDTRTAQRLFEAVLDEDPANPEALGGLARCHISDRALAEAQELLDGAPKEIQGHAAISGARAALALAREAGELGSPAALEARLKRDPADHEARYQLATVMFLRGQADAAMDQLIQIVKQDRAWNDDQARKQLVKFFDALGHKHVATLKGRRMLSTVLFS